MTESKKPKLELMPCDRRALECATVHLAWFGTNQQLHEAVRRLQPHGRLKCVPKSERKRDV